MKKGFLFLILLIVIGLAGCDEHKPTEAKDFNNNLKDFNKSLHHVDKTMDLMDQMDAEMKKVEDLKKSGTITVEEADRRLDLIRNKYAQKLVKSTGVKKGERLPEWAKRIGLYAPETMTLNLNKSQITSVNDKVTGYNSINFVYEGSYGVAMKQAALIAKSAGIPIGKDYQEALDLAKELNTEPVKGAVYMNFEIGKEDARQYHIAITVDETGTLTITATDVSQFTKQLEESTNQ
jgi:hypothetical protein